jgi:hypothetical protein
MVATFRSQALLNCILTMRIELTLDLISCVISLFIFNIGKGLSQFFKGLILKSFRTPHAQRNAIE